MTWTYWISIGPMVLTPEWILLSREFHTTKTKNIEDITRFLVEIKLKQLVRRLGYFLYLVSSECNERTLGHSAPIAGSHGIVVSFSNQCCSVYCLISSTAVWLILLSLHRRQNSNRADPDCRKHVWRQPWRSQIQSDPAHIGASVPFLPLSHLLSGLSAPSQFPPCLVKSLVKKKVVNLKVFIGAITSQQLKKRDMLSHTWVSPRREEMEAKAAREKERVLTTSPAI